MLVHRHAAAYVLGSPVLGPKERHVCVCYLGVSWWCVGLMGGFVRMTGWVLMLGSGCFWGCR